MTTKEKEKYAKCLNCGKKIFSIRKQIFEPFCSVKCKEEYNNKPKIKAIEKEVKESLM